MVLEAPLPQAAASPHSVSPRVFTPGPSASPRPPEAWKVGHPRRQGLARRPGGLGQEDRALRPVAGEELLELVQGYGTDQSLRVGEQLHARRPGPLRSRHNLRRQPARPLPG